MATGAHHTPRAGGPTGGGTALTPRQSIERECARRGTRAVVTGCARLIGGDYADVELILALGGPGAGPLVDGRSRADAYWFRVWGTRGLLWAWDDREAAVLTAAVTRALLDEAWRGREMAAKVVARHRLGDALAAVADLRDDPVLRVRVAAHRALWLLTEAGV